MPDDLGSTRPDPSTRNLTGWVLGFGASILADQVFFLSLTWAALQIGSPGEVGIVLAAGSIPRLLILLVGGVFADRVSPKWIIIGTDTGRALVMMGAAALLMVGSLNVWGLVVVALAIGALDGLFLPAVGALPARIAPAHLMGRVAALRTVTQRVAMLVGGPLAGWLIYLSGPSTAFWAAGGLFVVSVASLTLVAIRRDPGLAATGAAVEDTPAGEDTGAAGAPRPRFVALFREGLGVLRRDPVLPWLLLLVAAMNLGFAGPVTAGLPILASVSQWGAAGAGLLLGGFGLGAAVSGLILVFVAWIPRAGFVALASVLTMGIALASVGTLDTMWAALVATVVLGLASGVFGTVVHAMILTSTPKAELGRVMGLLSLSVEGVVPISFALSGVLAQLAGPHATLMIGGLVIIVSAVAASSRGALRRFELARPERAAVSEAAPVLTAAES